MFYLRKTSSVSDSDRSIDAFRCLLWSNDNLRRIFGVIVLILDLAVLFLCSSVVIGLRDQDPLSKSYPDGVVIEGSVELLGEVIIVSD